MLLRVDFVATAQVSIHGAVCVRGPLAARRGHRFVQQCLHRRHQQQPGAAATLVTTAGPRWSLPAETGRQHYSLLGHRQGTGIYALPIRADGFKVATCIPRSPLPLKACVSGSSAIQPPEESHRLRRREGLRHAALLIHARRLKIPSVWTGLHGRRGPVAAEVHSDPIVPHAPGEPGNRECNGTCRQRECRPKSFEREGLSRRRQQ